MCVEWWGWCAQFNSHSLSQPLFRSSFYSHRHSYMYIFHQMVLISLHWFYSNVCSFAWHTSVSSANENCIKIQPYTIRLKNETAWLCSKSKSEMENETTSKTTKNIKTEIQQNWDRFTWKYVRMKWSGFCGR